MVLRKHGLWQVIWGSSGHDHPCVEDPGKPLLALSTQRLQFIGSNWYSIGISVWRQTAFIVFRISGLLWGVFRGPRC